MVGLNRIDALAQAWVGQQTHPSQLALFRSMFGLQQWYYIGCGDNPDILPWIDFEEEEPHLMFFSESSRAAPYLAELGPSSSIIDINPDAALSYALMLADHGIEQIRFNHGPFGFSMATSALERMEREVSGATHPRIDALVMSATSTNETVDYNRVLQALCSLSRWYIVTEMAWPDQPVVSIANEEPCIVTFSNRSQASRFARQKQLGDTGGQNNSEGDRVVPLPVEHAQPYLNRLFKEGIRSAVFNDGPHQFVTPIEDLLKRVG